MQSYKIYTSTANFRGWTYLSTVCL